MIRRYSILSVVASASLFAQYSGPTVLSRGKSLTDTNRALPLGFQYYGGVSGVYDSGLTPVALDEKGNIPLFSNLFGVEAELGLLGTRRWAHGALGLSYNGDYRHYTKNTYFDGSDHVLGLEGRRELGKRLFVSSRTAAGTVARSISGLGGYANTPGYAYGLPTNDIFDNRAYFLQTTADLTYQKSTRMSFSVGGDGFFVRRQSKALVGVDGYGAHASLAYRLSRTKTADLSYSFLHFDYPRSFGESDMHQFTAGYSQRLSRNWEVALLGGVYRVETIGVTQVALDPVTAALFGQSTSIAAFHAVNYLPAVGASLTGQLSARSTFTVGYDRRPSPGNGVYLTSATENGTASLNLVGSSRLGFSFSGNVTRMKSIGQQGLGVYSAIGGTGGINYRFTRDLHLGLSADVRQMNIDVTNGFNRLGKRAMISIRYSPGEKPLHIWR